MEVTDYNSLPVPNISGINFESKKFDIKREVKVFSEEIKMRDRVMFDRNILKEILGDDTVIDQLYTEFEELVKDRLSSTKNKTKVDK